MTAPDFAAWLALMKARAGWSKRRAARELGATPNTILNWERSGAPPYVALACAALAYGLAPWRQVDPSERSQP